jgi:hypothetical protein
MTSNGFYTVGEHTYTDKIYALIEASSKNAPIEWHYYDDIFSSINTTALGSKNLKDLYKQRAIQLREKYDYLILNYSGGSDSHNILTAFLQNNIKLDCVFVAWHMKFTDKNLYTVNNIDRTNSNFHSEWDLTLKKDLEWLATHHSDIKIEIKDWTDNLTDTFYNDELFISRSPVMPNISRGLKLHTYSDTETELVSRGIKVGSIYGADKPHVIEKNNKCFCYFKDKSFSAQNNPNNPYGLEYFYITPDLPMLALEQAYNMFRWFNLNNDKRKIIKVHSERKDVQNHQLSDYYSEYEQYCEYVKLVCYPDWSFDRFQANKPVPGMGQLPGLKSWDNILLADPNTKRLSEIWNYHWKSYQTLIAEKYLRGDEHLILKSKWYYLGDFDVTGT